MSEYLELVKRELINEDKLPKELFPYIENLIEEKIEQHLNDNLRPAIDCVLESEDAKSSIRKIVTKALRDAFS